MDRIRVVHIINSMEVGGAQRQVLNLFQAADRARFDLRLICLAEKGAFGEQLEREGFPVRVIGKGRRVSLAMLMKLVSVLREWKPDVVHCSVFTANLWGRGAAILAGVPMVIAHEQSTVSLEKWYRRLIDRVLSWKTHRILAVSDDLRRRIVEEEEIAPRRVAVLYNAIDCASVQAAEPKAIEEPLQLPGCPGRRIGIVGRLEYRKDHLTLIRAAARVAQEMPEAAFLLVGDGPERGRLEEEIARLQIDQNVFLLGERADVPRLLHAFDIYVLCSITEGLSLSILEAMAAGLPIVATRVGGNPELLDEGRAGLLVPSGDPEALAQAILRLLREPEHARKLAQAAKERAENLFDIHPIARQLERIYEQSQR